MDDPKPLARRLARLAVDPDAIADLLEDPQSALLAAGLTESECSILVSGHRNATNALLTGQAAPESEPRTGVQQRPDDLIVAGTGIRVLGQLTLEAIAAIRSAEAVWFLGAEPVSEAVIELLNPTARSLAPMYREGKPRMETYREMVAQILESVRAGKKTCAVFYGHPGVFVYPSHEAVRQAREEGYGARMLAGVSAEDCLFADLGWDPAAGGCQSWEATDFLINRRRLDPSSHTILWQIGVLGEFGFLRGGQHLPALPLLIERLRESHPADHQVVLYEAATFPGCPPRIERVALQQLEQAELSLLTTLYLPPSRVPETDFSLHLQLTMWQKMAEEASPRTRKGQSRAAGAPVKSPK